MQTKIIADLHKDMNVSIISILKISCGYIQDFYYKKNDDQNHLVVNRTKQAYIAQEPTAGLPTLSNYTLKLY